MNLYYSRRGLKLWNGKELLARFIAIGDGLYSFSTNDQVLAKTLENHPFYRGELNRPETLTFNLPQAQGKITFPMAAAVDKKTGREIQVPIDVMVPQAVDSFYKADNVLKPVESKVLAGPQTSVNSAQGTAEERAKNEAERQVKLERMKAIEPRVISAATKKVLRTAPSELIEEYYTLKGELKL